MSLFNEAELREIIHEEVQSAVLQVMGTKPAAAGEFVSAAEAARIASVSSQTIRAWIRSGKLATYKAGRVLRVKRTELEDFLTTGPTPDNADDMSPEDLADRDFRERRAKRGQRGDAAATKGRGLTISQVSGSNQ
jgi:excisionase family DNA binding protein